MTVSGIIHSPDPYWTSSPINFSPWFISDENFAIIYSLSEEGVIRIFRVPPFPTGPIILGGWLSQPTEEAKLSPWSFKSSCTHAESWTEPSLIFSRLLQNILYVSFFMSDLGKLAFLNALRKNWVCQLTPSLEDSHFLSFADSLILRDKQAHMWSDWDHCT